MKFFLRILLVSKDKSSDKFSLLRLCLRLSTKFPTKNLTFWAMKKLTFSDKI